MSIPNQSVRIRDLERLQTPKDIAAKQEVLVPVASNGQVKESYSVPINTLAAWLLLNYAADKDLSNLTETGQSIIDHKQDYFFDNPVDSDLNTFTEDGIWKVEVTGAVECHTPNNLTGYFIISVDTADENTIEQQARELHTSPGNVYRRQRVNGTWGAWSMITQDMSNPIFINSPTVVNPGTSDNQLSTIGQLNSKFADVFKTQLYITEGLLITGLPSYSGGTLTIPAGSKYITNTSIETVVGTDITGTVPTSGRSFVFVDESQTIKTFTNFQKVMDVPETMESGTLYYIITSDTYQDINNIYQLAPIGIVDDGVFTQSDSIKLMNIDSLIAALGTLGIEDKVDQMVGDLAQNSQVSSDLEYSRTISAAAYDISNPEEPVMTSGARVSVQNKELSEDGSTLSNNPQFLAAATDGTNTSELIIKPDSARLKVPRLVVPSDIATLFDLDELNTNKADKTTDFQTPITSANKGATMAEITALDDDLQAQITSLKGGGGALNAFNFNAATPTQETLTKYAVDQIWSGNTNWAWNAANPAASTFTDANGVARTAAEIFNSTWVNNTYDDHRWQLTNTQNTTPKVFEWADVGRDIVSVATATTAGIVRVGSGSQMVVNPTTGDISLNGAKAAAIRTTIGAPGLSTENEYTDNAIYPLQKGIILQGANGKKYTIRTDASTPSGFIIYEGESSANIIFSFQPGDQNTITIGNVSYRIKAGSSGPLTSNDKTVATTEWVRDIITDQMGGDFVQYWDSGNATDHSHAKPGVATPASGTWYRLYKSGWVEQGGSVGNPNNGCILVTLPISMSNTSFTALASGNTSGDAANYNGVTCERKSSTQIAICTTGQQSKGCSWQVVGYAGGVSLFAYKATDGTVYYVGEIGMSDIDELILYMQDNEPGFLMQKNSSGGFDYVDYLPPIGITTSVLTIMLSTGGEIDCSRSPADDTLYYGK